MENFIHLFWPGIAQFTSCLCISSVRRFKLSDVQLTNLNHVLTYTTIRSSDELDIELLRREHCPPGHGLIILRQGVDKMLLNYIALFNIRRNHHDYVCRSSCKTLKRIHACFVSPPVGVLTDRSDAIFHDRTLEKGGIVMECIGLGPGHLDLLSASSDDILVIFGHGFCQGQCSCFNLDHGGYKSLAVPDRVVGSLTSI